MPTLLLARHAKSSWDDPSLRDHDRPLNRRGASDAPRIGAALLERDLVPDLVLSSTSARTRETLAGMEEGTGIPLTADYLPELYLASPGTMLSAIQSAPRDAETLMVLSHNPGTHALAVGLTATGPQEAREAMRFKFPTGAVAILTFDLDDWRHVRNDGHLEEFIRPRLLG
ncbi:MAG: histidine phosphatase family protein [Gemmatimonadetes bacterium]|nr:histidine phosphatase family protein [Gemmatimonadota bacterium]